MSSIIHFDPLTFDPQDIILSDQTDVDGKKIISMAHNDGMGNATPTIFMINLPRISVSLQDPKQNCGGLILAGQPDLKQNLSKKIGKIKSMTP